jgi:pyruvate/2-oxoglutarate dehydrogenase complex dihydrolipoamide dehydrogenase (E3) component
MTTHLELGSESAMYDLVVIGAGSAGLGVATAAAKVGARVAVIEKKPAGGSSSIAARVGSKGLVQAARLAHEVRQAARFGVNTGPPSIDFAAVMRRVRQVAAEIARSESAEALAAQGIDVYQGSASFAAYDTVLVDEHTRVAGHRFVIATGSRPAVPEIPGLAEARYLDGESIWSLEKLPESLVVVGADPRGLEFAQCFTRLGSKVTVLTDSPRLLPQEEPEASELLTRLLSAEGVVIRTGVEITKIEIRGASRVCRFRDPATDTADEIAGESILLASGQRANIESLNLDAVGIHGDADNGIEVDDYLQTHSTRIYAIGDVLLRLPYTHAAQREAAVAFQNAVLRIKKKIDYSRLPRATFLDPELAAVGLTEAQASALERPTRVYRVDFADIDRARIDGRTDGFAKVIATPSGKITGATVVGENAGMILQELVVAMRANLSLGDLAGAVPIYPTYAAAIRHLANQHREGRLERGYVQTALKLFYGFVPRVAGRNGPPAKPAEAPAAEHPAADVHEHGH